MPVFVIEVPIMFMHCLNCAEIIHHQLVIPLVMVRKSYFSWPDVQEENDKFFIRCPNCNEAYYSIEIQRKIDGIMMAFHEGRLLAQPFAAVRLT